MNKIYTLLSLLLMFATACSDAPRKKPDRQEIMKKGQELFARYGCAVCHSLDGEVIYGPPLNAIFMKEIKVIRNGSELTLVADRKYLKKAITDPRYEKVLEYRNKEMPISTFSDEEAEILVDYIIALSEAANADK